MPVRHTPLLAALCVGATALGLPSAASASPSHQCKSIVVKAFQGDTVPKALEAATEISIRGGSCRTARSLIGGMILQVAAARNLAPTSPNYYADDRDFLTKKRWTIAHVSGDLMGPIGARWHITKGKASVRFTRWR